MERFLKFVVVGIIGFIINTIVLVSGVRIGMRPSIAGPLGAELAIIFGFLANNFWTFSESKITSWTVLPWKFLQYNIVAFGSVLIQFIFLRTGEKIFGLEAFKRPVLDLPIFKKIPLVKVFAFAQPLTDRFTAYMVFYMAGVGVGLVWNFIMYSRVIWQS